MNIGDIIDKLFGFLLIGRPKENYMGIDRYIDQFLVLLLADGPEEIQFQCSVDSVVIRERVEAQWYNTPPIQRLHLKEVCGRQVSDVGALFCKSFAGRRDPFLVSTVDGPISISMDISNCLIRLLMPSVPTKKAT